MIKTFLKEATVLSVFDFHNDEKIFLGEMLFGIVPVSYTHLTLPTSDLV